MSAGSQSHAPESLPRTSTPTNQPLNTSDSHNHPNLSASSGNPIDPDDLAPHCEMIEPGQLDVPILGYEVMEERAKFTVFKLQVLKGVCESWFIFRRYSDFARLNDKLSQLFPHFRLALPPKKWFGDNFDVNFLEDRILGLQAFLNNVVSHRDMCNSLAVQEFLCVSKPPGPHDSLEESRAWCEHLESQVYQMKQLLQDKDCQLALLRDECSIYREEVSNLRRALRVERRLPQMSPTSSNPSESSLTEQEQAEVDCDHRLPVHTQGDKPTKPSPSLVKDSKSMTTMLKVEIPSDDLTCVQKSVSAT